MASKHKSRIRNEVIRCENCGEDYSVTYRSCPFCDESAARSAGRRGGGKRLNTRGGGYGGGWGPLRIITTLLSVALIIAAVYIVVTIVKPLVELGNEKTGISATDTPALDTPSGEPTVEPTAEPTPDTTVEPTPESPSSSQAADSFTLNASDFTLTHSGDTYRIRATFSPAGSTGSITWTSSNPEAVHVDSNGTVTALAKGNSTITAALENGHTEKCIVRCGWSDGSVAPTPGSGSTPATSTANTGLALNRTDFTMSREGETFMLKVSGTDSAPAWSSSDSSVAGVSSSGKVTALKHGTVTVTATVDGQTLKCIVRCNF